jgi:NAD(P)-dependent dehydrogenase (short-subunit alcohol dehydrogenase family)
MYSRVKEKVVIVTGKYYSHLHFKDTIPIDFTGANSPNGIGRASAHQFANNGAKAVYICDFSDNHMATHKRELESLYPDVDIHVRSFDAADEKALSAVIDEAISKYGRLDVFFANAGVVGQPKIFTEIDGEGFLNTMRVNALGYVHP